MGACLCHGDKLCLSCLPVPETQLTCAEGLCSVPRAKIFCVRVLSCNSTVQNLCDVLQSRVIFQNRSQRLPASVVYFLVLFSVKPGTSIYLCRALCLILYRRCFIYSYNPVEGDISIPLLQVQRGQVMWPKSHSRFFMDPRF